MGGNFDSDNPTTERIKKSSLANAEDELFWRRVREAYQRVTTDHSEIIEIELAGRNARVQAISTEKITIMIREVPREPVKLIVPHAPGATDKD